MILLSLGSNLTSKYGDRFDNLNFAISLLEKRSIIIHKKSSFYETFSYPDKKKPKFINLVISVKTDLSVNDLMTILITIESKLDRKREKKNDPRTCDIDIIDFKGEILNIKHKNLNLIIPHENLSSRNFVLFPIKEIAPTWKHPKTHENIDTLIQKLSEEDRKSILKIKKNDII